MTPTQDLQRIIDAWPTLTEVQRQALLLSVVAFTSGQKGGAR